MMPPHLRPVLRALEARLRAVFAGRLNDVQLFGSYARGEAAEDSDVDVLVLIDGLEQSEIATVSDCTTEIALATRTALATLPISTATFATMSATGRGLAAEIARDGARP